MATKSAIEWTESTWNPITGCTKISAGCKNCYAERMAKRLQLMGQPNYRDGFNKVVCHEHALDLPLKWKKPQTIFVNSMSDLFHQDVPEEFIGKIFDVMNTATQHRYQILTKRAERLAQLSLGLPWSKNIWMGVTVEDRNAVQRIDYLRQTKAFIKFLSIEPLISSVGKLDLSGIDWVIVGGESGPQARPIKEEWVIEIFEQCQAQNTPFFFKQWGGINKKKTGRKLNNRTYDEMPLKAMAIPA